MIDLRHQPRALDPVGHLDRRAVGVDGRGRRDARHHRLAAPDHRAPRQNNELQTSDATGQDGQTTYQHDPADNVTASSAGFEANYNTRNQITRMRGPDSLGGALGAEGETTFAYAGPGQAQRTEKDSILFSGSSQRVDYDDSERIQAVRSRRSGDNGPVVHGPDYDYRDPTRVQRR